MGKLNIKFNRYVFFTALAVFVNIYNYYQFLIPGLSSLFSLIYRFGRLLFSLLFFVEILSLFNKKSKETFKYTNSFFFIILFIIINYIYIFLSEMNLSFLSSSFQLISAKGTNDFVGYYFSNFITWTGNCGIAIWLINNVKNNQDVITCLKTAMWMLVIPIILVMVMHPEYIGQRISDLESTKFGGGIWNIGVFGFCSVAWLLIMQQQFMKKKDVNLSYFGIFILILSGIIGLSRSFVLSLLISFLYYFLKTSKNINRIMKNFIIIVLVFIFLIFIYTIDPSLFESILGRFHDSTSGTRNVRFLLWQNYLRYYKEYFIFGAPLGGPYNYYHYLSYKGYSFLPHSSLINFLIMSGIGGLLSYLSILKKIFVAKNVNNIQIKYCLKSMIISYCILAFVNQTGFSQIIFYVSFGLALATIKINSEVDAKDENRNNN